ncbi:MAG: OmpA family protein [Acinetobacter sp.]|uniref:OmpA family protein n=1 Tax=Acinetobacter sp. TaxID=472 RepID=UPI0026DF92BC|nr:OmpA family protein [Acinetobacter sp.]MDO5542153.1 OmpA family protein [Acinetobacter sp.]
MKNNQKNIRVNLLIGLSLLVQSHLTCAAPIIIEGVVPNEASKQAILAKMQAVYGEAQVLDKIQVRAVAAPNGWDDSVTRIITADLKKISQGQLRVKGTQIYLKGKVNAAHQIQATTANFQALVQQPYRLNTQLSENQYEQKMLDTALKNRIIEFESGSVILTDVGQKILDEMAVAFKQVGTKKVKIVGHTDSSGDANKNIALSQSRADAVKNYLVDKGIAATHLSTEGQGANQPVADNTTPEGRKKNRRIEFEVL